MPLDSSQIWTLTPATTRLLAVRSDVDSALGLTLDYDRTLDGAYTTAAALAVYRVDQGVQLAVSSILAGSAPPQGVVARARAAGLNPKPAVAEQVLVAVTGMGTLREASKVLDDNGQSFDILSVYTLVGAALSPSPFVDGSQPVTSATRVLAQATDAKELEASSSYTLSPSVSGVTIALDGVSGLIRRGRDEETTAQLRSRLSESDAHPSGSMAGLRAALLDVTGVTGISITQKGAGVLEVGLVYNGGLIDLALFAETLYRHMPATATTSGTTTVQVVGVDGRDVDVSYTVETPQSVAVVATLTTDTASDVDAIAAATIAIDAVFSRLAPGETLRILQVQGALADIPGVVGLALLTLDGTTSDVIPATSTTTLAAVQTVTVA